MSSRIKKGLLLPQILFSMIYKRNNLLKKQFEKCFFSVFLLSHDVIGLKNISHSHTQIQKFRTSIRLSQSNLTSRGPNLRNVANSRFGYGNCTTELSYPCRWNIHCIHKEFLIAGLTSIFIRNNNIIKRRLKYIETLFKQIIILWFIIFFQSNVDLFSRIHCKP